MTKTKTKATAAAKECRRIRAAHRARLRREPQTAGGVVSGLGCGAGRQGRPAHGPQGLSSGHR